MKYRVGIDPGVHTGFAVAADGQLMEVCSLPQHEAMHRIRKMHENGTLHSVVFEDARLRTWFGAKGKEALQGAGSIKRDCQIWADTLGFWGVPYRQVKPAAGATKWRADYFQKRTGWAGRTNEHGRDAALLVYERPCDKIRTHDPCQ